VAALASESVAALNRNQWPFWIGISGRFASECALLPGYSDYLIYDIGALDTSVPIEELRRKSRIDPAVTGIDDPEFSRKIRGL